MALKKDELTALMALGLAPKAPPRALKARLMAAVQSPAIELRQSRGTVEVEGGAVRTGGDGQVELRVKGQVLVALRENSRALLRWGAHGLELLMEKGGAMIQVAPGTPFRTQMPLGLIEVKGTWFYAEAQGPRRSYVCLCEGWVALSAEGFKTELKTKGHQAVTLVQKKGLVEAVPASKQHWHPKVGPLR